MTGATQTGAAPTAMPAAFQPLRTLLAIAVLALVLPLAAATAEDAPAFKQHTTPGGMAFYHRFDASTPFAALTFGLRNSYAAATRGGEALSEIAGSLVMQGADGAGQSEFVERLKDLTATASVSFGPYGMSGMAKAPAERLADAMQLLAAALTSAQPTDKILRRLRHRATGAEIQAATRSETIAMRSALRLALGDHPATRAFDPRRFERLALDDLARWRARALDRAGLRIVASGKLHAQAAARIIDSAFAGVPARLEPIAFAWPDVRIPARTVVIERETAQTAIAIVGLTSVVAGPDAILATIANQVLGGSSGSRLWRSVRASLGSTYGAYSRLSSVDPKRRLIVLSTSVANDKIKHSLEAMRTTYTRWRTDGLTEPELRAAASRMATAFASAMNDPARANAMVLGALLNGLTIEQLHNREARLRALRLQEVNDYIAANFPPLDRLLVVVVTPASTGLEADCVIAAKAPLQSCPN